MLSNKIIVHFAFSFFNTREHFLMFPVPHISACERRKKILSHRGWARRPWSSPALWSRRYLITPLKARRSRSAGWTALWSSWETEQRSRRCGGPLTWRAPYSPDPRSALGTNSATSCTAHSGPWIRRAELVRKKMETFERNVCRLTSLLRKQYRTATINPWKTRLNLRLNLRFGFEIRTFTQTDGAGVTWKDPSPRSKKILMYFKFVSDGSVM